MRPRINKFGKTSYRDIHAYLTDNQVYGFIAYQKDNSIVYSYNMMFRSNKEKPEILFIEVSKTSKLIITAWTNKNVKFANVDELKKYTKKTW